MSVDAVVYYRVSNATVSVANVENAHHSTRLLAQTTLRNILGELQSGVPVFEGGPSPQCGNYRIFLSLTFYVKSKMVKLET